MRDRGDLAIGQDLSGHRCGEEAHRSAYPGQQAPVIDKQPHCIRAGGAILGGQLMGHCAGMLGLHRLSSVLGDSINAAKQFDPGRMNLLAFATATWQPSLAMRVLSRTGENQQD
jgi:hypothetical protein